VTSNDDELPPNRGKTRWLQEQLLRRIESGVWADGRELPSEDVREYQPMSTWLDGYRPPFEEKPIAYDKDGRPRYLSKRMSRDPVILLAAIGRVITRHGEGSWVYMPSMEPHRLAVDLRRPSSTKLEWVAEPGPHPAVELIPAPGSKVDTRWHEGKDEYTLPAWDSERLGIDAGTKLRAYTLTLLIDGEPILASTSLVPSDLLGGAVKWKQTSEGELALDGVSATFSYPTLHGRIPTLDESKTLKPLKPLDGIPAFAVYRQCRVTPVGVSATPRKACVLVVARTDRVHL
jgi:hypothetical protein